MRTDELLDHEDLMINRGCNWDGYKGNYLRKGLTELEAVTIYESDVAELLRLKGDTPLNERS
jgi:hypothetical protein